MSNLRRPEILAPAGNEEMMRAAVENGADAIYFGLQSFNARLRAANFDAAELPRLMAWLHERGVKGYVTLNTLVFCGELREAADVLQHCARAGVDAVLVQDLGVAWLAGRLVPGLTIHASTQMTLASAESIAAAESLGLRIDRVVAPRELSRKDLRNLRRETDKEIEVFIHGALCVAYSGQCLTSEALGGRSANRGECAQACRLPYDLVVDGEKRDLGDVNYLLSPRDLAAYEDIGDLIDTGIVSLKIEGRLKSPQYVAATVQSYRQAVDEAIPPDATAPRAPRLDEITRRRLEGTFSRGFTGGYLHAVDHQAVVEGRYPKKRGLFLGRVVSVQRDTVTIRFEGPIKPGDGVVFDAGHPDRDEVGGRVFELHEGRSPVERHDPLLGDPSPRLLRVGFDRKRVDLSGVHEGDRVWLTSDHELDRELAASYAEGKIHFQRPVTARVEGRLGEPLALVLRDWEGNEVRVLDTAPAEAASRRPLSHDVLRDQLGRMGNSPFRLESLEAHLEGDLLVPFSRLNDLRRRAVEELVARRRAQGRSEPAKISVEDILLPIPSPPATVSRPPVLSALCRTLEQVDACVDHGGVDTIYTDFEDPRLHREARLRIPTSGPRFAPATLRVMKPAEAPIARKLLEAAPDAILVRNLGAWQVLRHEAPALPLIADYSLNVANHLTARLLHEHGLHRITPGYDLNIDQLLDLLHNAPPHWFEVTAHQYMPMFHMEHCVFCRFLSDGTDFTNCGRPCETHQLALRDRMGFEHPVKADAGCRNTVFNAVAQSASEYLAPLLDAGVRRYRIDFLSENGGAVREALNAYLSVIRGQSAGHDLWRRLKARSKLGVTRGSLDHE